MSYNPPRETPSTHNRQPVQASHTLNAAHDRHAQVHAATETTRACNSSVHNVTRTTTAAATAAAVGWRSAPACNV